MSVSRRKLSLPKRFIAFWARHLQQGTASLGDIWRNPTSSLMTIAVIGVCLALLITFYLAIKNVEAVIPSWQQNAQISVFVEPSASDVQREQLAAKLRQLDGVASIQLIDKVTGLAEFKKDSGFGAALDLMDDNPLPDVFIVTPKASQHQPQQLQQLQQQLAKEPYVSQARLDVEWLQRLSGILDVVNQALLLLFGLLLISIILTVGNTIRLNVLSQRAEIEVMKLVGATNAFIQRPFIYTGFWYGFIGGLLAWLLNNILMLWLSSAAGQLASLYQQSLYLRGLDLAEFTNLLFGSSLLGILSAWFSVSRYVKKIEPR
ncbi:permease-like cell division protein FtsX [Celerinatantimonas sp. YJH-8]|uniref:permease-like cell division protein FtsX n=1 Tax=Celerinatantimonas sp. YJH-8 TaxID=3228714 RepID=UPI0038CAB610